MDVNRLLSADGLKRLKAEVLGLGYVEDLADALELIRALALPRETAESLEPAVRGKEEPGQAAQMAEPDDAGAADHGRAPDAPFAFYGRGTGQTAPPVPLADALPGSPALPVFWP